MRRLVMLAAAALLLVGVGWYEGLYKPETSHIAKLQTNEQVVESQVLALQSRYAGLLSSKKSLPAERAALPRPQRRHTTGPGPGQTFGGPRQGGGQGRVQVTTIGSPVPPGFGIAPTPTTVAPTQTTVPTTQASGASPYRRPRRRRWGRQTLP